MPSVLQYFIPPINKSYIITSLRGGCDVLWSGLYVLCVLVLWTTSRFHTAVYNYSQGMLVSGKQCTEGRNFGVSAPSLSALPPADWHPSVISLTGFWCSALCRGNVCCPQRPYHYLVTYLLTYQKWNICQQSTTETNTAESHATSYQLDHTETDQSRKRHKVKIPPVDCCSFHRSLCQRPCRTSRRQPRYHPGI